MHSPCLESLLPFHWNVIMIFTLRIPLECPVHVFRSISLIIWPCYMRNNSSLSNVLLVLHIYCFVSVMVGVVIHFHLVYVDVLSLLFLPLNSPGKLIPRIKFFYFFYFSTPSYYSSSEDHAYMNSAFVFISWFPSILRPHYLAIYLNFSL